MSEYLVIGFITARRSAGRAASRVFALGLVGVASEPSTVFLMWQFAHPPLLVLLVFIVNAPDVEVLLLYWLSQRPTWVLPIFPILKWIRLEPSRLALWLNPKIKTLIDRLENEVAPTVPLMVMVLVSPTSQ